MDKTDLNILNGSTDIDDETTENQVQIYPNPTNNRLYATNISDVTDMTIFNLNGMQVLKTNTSPIDISILPNGNYFLRVNQYNQQSIVPFVIKR